MLEKQYGIKGGLVGQDILVMPSSDGNARQTASAVFRKVRQLEESFPSTVQPIAVYFMDETGQVWRQTSTRDAVRVGSRIPD
jgi:hypothetical protein